MKALRLAFVLILMFSGFSIYAQLGARNSNDEIPGAKAPIGTFDSRAVAVAYTRSETFMQYIKELKIEHQKAKAEGNEERAKELETLGSSLQDKAHKQGFSTWPVDDILEKIRDEIPGIAHEAGVDIIVSKWDIVYQQPDIEFVDVTDLLVALFNPDENTQTIIEQMKEIEPLTLEELEEEMKQAPE
jgi:hypothetical protein